MDFVKWLADSSGIIFTHYVKGGTVNGVYKGEGKYSHFVLKLDNLNKPIPIPGLFGNRTVETASISAGKQILDLIADLKLMGKGQVMKIDSVHLEKRNKENFAVEWKGATIPLPTHNEKLYLNSCVLSPTGDQLLWGFQENYGNGFSGAISSILNRRLKPEFIVTNVEGKVTHTLPPLETPSKIIWMPDGKHLSYMSKKEIFVMELN